MDDAICGAPRGGPTHPQPHPPLVESRSAGRRRGAHEHGSNAARGAISVLLSNVYLHYVLDLGFEKAIKPRLDGEAYLMRYIDDFVVCFQHQRDAERFQAVLSPRLHKFHLDLEPTKTRLIAFGRFAQRDAQAQGRKKPDTLYFLGFTHYCTRNRHGGFMVGRKTEKSRVRRTIQRLQATMRQIHVMTDWRTKSTPSTNSSKATMRILAWQETSPASNRSIGSPPGTGDAC